MKLKHFNFTVIFIQLFFLTLAFLLKAHFSVLIWVGLMGLVSILITVVSTKRNQQEQL